MRPIHCTPGTPGRSIPELDSPGVQDRRDCSSDSALQTPPSDGDPAAGRGPIRVRERCARDVILRICQQSQIVAPLQSEPVPHFARNPQREVSNPQEPSADSILAQKGGPFPGLSRILASLAEGFATGNPSGNAATGLHVGFTPLRWAVKALEYAL
jgi:hypothetical protein